METLIHILHLEDDPADAALVHAKIEEGNLSCRITLVQTRDEYDYALQRNRHDIILADFKLPMYDGMSALGLAKELRPDIPFVFVSGTMGEDAAIEGLTKGATDYVLKQNLSRLPSAIKRALSEARIRRERQKAERALAKSEKMIRAIIEAAPVAIIGMDLEGRVHSVWNPAAEKMLGWRAQEVMGRPMPAVSADHQEEFKYIKEQISKGIALDGVEARRQRRDGTPIDYSIYAAPLHDAEENISGNISVLVDITERKQAETRLNEQLHFLQQLIDSIPIPVYYKDPEGLYLGCNAAFEAYTDLPRENIVGKTVHQVIPKERADKHHAADLDLLRHPGVQTYEVSGIYQDGEHHDVVFNKATFVDADGCVAGTVGALMDITARKRAEQERLANLEFFESMDRINRAIQGAADPEEMMKEVLDVVLSTLDVDRAYLMYPCDPEAPSWAIPMERHKPEYPVVRDSKMGVPMDPQVAESLRIVLAADGPVTFGPGTPHALPEDMSKQFGFKCAMAMAIHPKTGGPWQFGIHQCADVRLWTKEEMRLFLSIGRRLADGLSSLLSYRDLRKSEEFLDNVVEHIPNMIFVKEAQTLEFVRFNRAGEQLLGYSREELLGKSDYDFFPKEEADFFTAKDREVLATKTLLDIPEETILNRSNEERILHTQKLPILDDAGNPQFLLGISEDITERMQTQASIRKLSQAIEQSPVSIVITDIEGRIEFVNAKFTQVSGYTFAEALGRNPRIFKSGGTSDEEYKRLWKTISSGGVWRGKFQNRKKNGELFWEQASIAPIRNAENVITHYLGIKEDITERKKLEEQLRQSQKMEAVGQLAGGVAHDFNNMLGVIMGRAELALEKVVPEDSLHRDLEEIMAAGLRSAEITRQLLAFSRKQTIEPKILDLNEAIEGMLKLLRRLIGEGIDLAWLPGTNLWPVRIDPSQIDQILANLCINAKDAIGGVGKITIETHRAEFDDAYCAKHEGFHPGEFVMLTVSDNGSGMDKPTLERIFEPFFTTKGLGKGTGLGLATVYGIVKQNTGFINVYSEPGYGSTFRIYFPRHIVTADREEETIAAAPIPSGRETILVVEDEIMYLRMVTLMLEKFGYRVLSASTPGEALLLAKEHTGEIHLLLTDLIMPEMNGRDLDRKITALYPDIISVFMSGYTSGHIIHDGALDEGIHFIQKPFTSQALAKMVREVLDNK